MPVPGRMGPGAPARRMTARVRVVGAAAEPFGGRAMSSVDCPNMHRIFRSLGNMKNKLDFDVHRPQAIYQQIRRHVRQLIRNRSLAPGEKLPPTSELAARWNTHPASIHAALSPLVKEGLLDRRPRLGTFVTARSARLLEIGIYYDSDIWSHHASAFKRAIHRDLVDLLGARKMNVRVWADTRGNSQQGSPWDELKAATERREAQAIMATDVSDATIAWLEEMPIPMAYFTLGRAPVNNKVSLDFRQFAMASVSSLKAKGCRSAGVISIVTQQGRSAASRRIAENDLGGHFAAACRQHGLEVRDEWIRMAPDFIRDESQEDFGYVEFREIWKRPKRPEGLVIFPDTSVPGVITSILERHVRVPAELKIVAHRHAEINILCPLPVTYLYSSTQQIARAMIWQIQCQMDGESCQPIILPFQSRNAFRNDPWTKSAAVNDGAKVPARERNQTS